MPKTTATKWHAATQLQMTLVSPEIKALPPNWSACHEEQDPFKIFYVGPKNAKDPSGEKIKSWIHPTLGPLPPDWTLCNVIVDKKNGKREPRYWNSKTRKSTKENPRFLPGVLKAREKQKTPSVATRIGSSILKNKAGFFDNLHRGEIGRDPALRDQYEIVHTIDDGGGGLGGMNGGVYVVRVKGFPQLYVEKRFKSDHFDLVEKEVEMVHRMRHGAITLFCAGFVDHKTLTASLVTEFCDRGSWEDMHKMYIAKRLEVGPNGALPFVPELFIWNAFLGIADAFAYLEGGRSYLNDPIGQVGKAVDGWSPVLHRDMKPDNVLMRSRTTLGANKYFYCMLSDFGLACEEDKPDKNQKNGGILGTLRFQPGELCYDPYQKTLNDHMIYPNNARHSIYTDVWALGASIYCLCNCDEVVVDGVSFANSSMSHLSWEDKPEHIDYVTWMHGRASRKKVMELPNHYSQQLNTAVIAATSDDRPDAIGLVCHLKDLMNKAGIEGTGPRKESDRVPDWATRVHDFYLRMKDL